MSPHRWCVLIPYILPPVGGDMLCLVAGWVGGRRGDLGGTGLTCPPYHTIRFMLEIYPHLFTLHVPHRWGDSF